MMLDPLRGPQSSGGTELGAQIINVNWEAKNEAIKGGMISDN